MTQKKLRLGIMGLGKIATKSMIPALKNNSKVELVALASRSLEKAERVALSCGARLSFGSYEALLASDEIEAVYIALPNHLHCEWSVKAAQSGKHILCEKPLATSVKEAEEMIEAARVNNVYILEAFMYRMHPQHRVVKEMIASGAIGEVQHFNASFCYSLSDLNNIRLKKECAGGALMDVGCYLLDSACWLLESKIKKSQVLFVIGKKSAVDERCVIQIEMENGVSGSLLSSTGMPREHAYKIIGSEGSISVPTAYIPPANKRVHVLVKNDEGEKIIKIDGVNQYAEQCEAFADLIYVNKEAALENGLENCKNIEKIKDSYEQ